jgi:hypothetical protein
MGAKRLYLLLRIGLGLAIILLLLSAYAANQLLKGQSEAVRETRLKNIVLEEKQRQLAKSKADIQKYQGLADIAKNIVPQDKDQAQTVREIVSIAEANGIKLGGITFPASSLGDKKSPLSQLKAEKGLPGVYALEITVQSDSSSPARFADFLTFLDALEHNRRTALVTGIAIQPDVADPSRLAFTLTLKEYIKP